MPSALVVEAATPKCMHGPDGRMIPFENPDGVRPCDRRLFYCHDEVEGHYWACPEHGFATTVESLVHRQGDLAAASDGDDG